MKLRLTALLPLLLAGCTTTSQMRPDTIPPELSTAVPAMMNAWKGTDVAAFRPLYADNIVVITTSDRYNGWNEVRARWLEPGLPNMSQFRSFDHNFTREGADIIESGRYSFRIMQNGQADDMRGTYAQRWQLQGDGTWRVTSINVQ